MSDQTAVTPRERTALLNSLSAGLFPRVGWKHTIVDRDEIKVIVSAIDLVADGGSTVRLLTGGLGHGKTFTVEVIRDFAHSRRLVTLYAEVDRDLLLCSGTGKAVALFRQLMSNAATRFSPGGHAVPSIAESFISQARDEAGQSKRMVEEVIKERTASLRDLPCGYDFGEVLAAYYRGHDTMDDELKSNSLRWLRGEFTSKVDAKRLLNVRSIIGDAGVYDALKLLCRFVRLAGYTGVVVCLDEMSRWCALDSKTRADNYARIHRIVDDCFQGDVPGLGFVFAGTQDFVFDPKRGLFSSPALKSRLSGPEIVGLSPVVNLPPLSPESVYVLLTKIRRVFYGDEADGYVVPDDALRVFLERINTKLGATVFVSPREIVKTFVAFLALAQQQPEQAWQAALNRIMPTVASKKEVNDELEPVY